MSAEIRGGALEVALPCSPENALMSSGGETTPPKGEHGMSNDWALALKVNRRGAAEVTRELASLNKMSVGELAEKFREVFGQPTRTRNKEYLRKRIAWRIQELTEGGLSLQALERIEQLAPQAPARWRQPTARADSKNPPATSMGLARDPRLPQPGTVLTRVHDGVEHKVIVLADGFEYGGERYRSLSKIARVITGTPWNGFLFFFGRGHRARAGAEELVG